MLNFRKLRQDFSSSILKEGKDLFENESVLGAKILHMDGDTIKLSSRVKGSFENVYESEVEINRMESTAIDSNCDCTYTYDCQHIAAFLYFLEKNLHEIVVNYSEDVLEVDEELQETFEQAHEMQEKQRDSAFQKEVLSEYITSANALAASPFFLPQENMQEATAELALLFVEENTLQLALRLPSRSKPLFIADVRRFLDALQYKEPIHLNGKRYFFTPTSFDVAGREVLRILIDHATFPKDDLVRTFHLDKASVGLLLSRVYDLAMAKGAQVDREALPLPYLYNGNLEEPICYCPSPAHINCTLEYLEAPGPTLLLNPSLTVDEDEVAPEDVMLFPSTKPGLIHKNTYFRFPPQVKRVHLQQLASLRDVTIPEPLFGSFVENALPVLRQYATVTNPLIINRLTTLPYTDKIKGRCEIHYLNGELEAKLFFRYGNVEIPAAHAQLDYAQIASFVGQEGILARSLVEERKIAEAVFEDFLFDEKEGSYCVKSEKKIVEFMTEVIPRFQDQIDFECPENLKEQFIYDDSTFELKLSTSKKVSSYAVQLQVNGYLKGVRLDLLWDCIAAKRRFVEIDQGKTKLPRILVLDLEKIIPVIQLFDEIGLKKLEDYTEYRPLWSLTTLSATQFKGLPVTFSMSKELKEIQQQILGEKEIVFDPVPTSINATLRNYQLEGVHWLQRLRAMHLGGILADDMGLGKTLQAIIAIVQSRKERASLIVCPTSLLYNWQEEFHKFHPESKVLIIDSTPAQRRKLLKTIDQYDIIVTSYNLLQKDIEIYQKLTFDYVVLDEAQHIKNRGTRNAKSVKMIQAEHRLILTGTPIENSLDELWSLFDFLMPGLLSSYDRFVERFIRGTKGKDMLEVLRRKVSPFVLRRMKEDVLDDLPPVTEVLYHCHLTPAQEELYRSYAESAKEELSRLVKKEGFDKIQIHVLATLTRLKQICCHPAIFAKEKAEPGDSAKYDMLLELMLSLIEGKHKSVIFSQYTKMLTILREELQSRGIPFAYLDGSSKNRLDIVKRFNEDETIPIFLVSLKAGGSGLNLTGADTVIHYDMWWNPAVENQATDRVHRLGQQKSVSSYKLVTLNTIEEKILNLQKRKRGLVKKLIDTDEETIAKLTWEEVLELLQT
ncbi:MAG: SNF2 helicase associated domain-containing protein [Chlamydiales bacterium]|nr:SNF2 helicase associated domain-containing protein [Chlamydiales bacterium]